MAFFFFSSVAYIYYKKYGEQIGDVNRHKWDKQPWSRLYFINAVRETLHRIIILVAIKLTGNSKAVLLNHKKIIGCDL